MRPAELGMAEAVSFMGGNNWPGIAIDILSLDRRSLGFDYELCVQGLESDDVRETSERAPQRSDRRKGSLN